MNILKLIFGKRRQYKETVFTDKYGEPKIFNQKGGINNPPLTEKPLIQPSPIPSLRK